MPDYNRIIADLNRVAHRDYSTNTTQGQSLSVRASDPSVNPTRYPTYFIGLDNEEIYGQNQSRASKWGNGLVKGVGLTATTFLQGTVGLVNGVYQALADQNFSSFYDNRLNKVLNDFSTGREDRFANYYTRAERDAAWYSPSTWATANFWSDTILKNMGFAAGAYLSGGVLSKGISAGLKGLSTALNRANPTITTALETATRAENASLLTTQGSVLQGVGRTAEGLAELSGRQLVNNAWKTWGKTATHAVLSASGEASIEAYHAKNDYKEKLIQQYRDNTGQEPSEKVLAEIEDTASSIGNTTFGLNMALLTATNFVQFPLLSKTASGEASVLARSQREAMFNVVDKEGKVISRSWGRNFNPVANTVKGESLQAVKTATGIGNQLERFAVGRLVNKVAPVAKTIFSPREAFEEGAQYLAPSFAEDYFDKGSSTKGEIFGSLKKTLSESLDEKDFWVSLMSGGLTGGIMENMNPMNGNFGRPFRDKRRSAQLSNELVNAHNNNPLSGYIADIAQSFAREQILAEEAADAIRNGDRLEFEDKSTDSRLNYLIPRLQYGRGDLVQADINNWRQLASTEEGWQQAVENQNVPEGITRQDFLKGLEKLENDFRVTSKVFENLNLRYGTSFDAEGNPTHNKDVLMKMAYIQSKIDDYNNRITTLSSELDEVMPVAPLLTALSNRNSEESLVLPDGESVTLTPDNIDSVVDRYFNYLTENLRDDSTKTADDVDEILNKFSDVIQLTARRSIKVEEYNLMRDNPKAYEDDLNSTDYIPEDTSIDSDLEREPADNRTKTNFFNQFSTEPVVLNFGERGQEVGKLKYNSRDGVLAVERTDGTLYEITNQDFKDGLVYFQNSDVIIPSEFLGMEDERTAVKRAETISKIKERFLEKQGSLEKANTRVEKIQSKLSSVAARISGSNPSASSELSELEKRYDELREKVNQSSTAKSAERRFMQGELTEEEVVKILDDLFDARGGKEVSDRIDYLRKSIVEDTLESYEKASVTIQELQEINDSLNEELGEATQEQQQLQDEYNVYQQLLQDANPDFNFTLNVIEEQLKSIEQLQKDLSSHKSRIEQLMSDVMNAVRYLVSLIGVKNNLSPSVHTNAINKAVDDFLSGRAGPEVLVGLLNGIDKRLVLSKTQYDKLASQLEQVNKELDNVKKDLQARGNVYLELLDRAFVIENPLDPTYFVEVGSVPTETAETDTEISEDVSEQEPTDDAVGQSRGRYDGTKKLLSRLFSSTILLPDDQQNQSWYKMYQRFIRNISTIPWEERQNLRVKLITARNEEKAGLKGYTDYNSNNGYKGKESKKLDPSEGLITAVVVKTKPDGTQVYLDADFNEIGKVGEQLSPENTEKVVGTRLPLARLTFLGSKEENYAKAEQVNTSPEEVALSYLGLRKEILESESLDMDYAFDVSRGQLPSERKENTIVGNLIPEGGLSDRPLLRLVKNGETITNPDGQDVKLTKGSVVMLENEGALTPLYVGNQSEELVMGLIKALQHTVTNLQNSGGADIQMLNFIKASIPYGAKFDENNLTLTYKKVVYDLKNPNFAKELMQVLLRSKVRVDHPMMTPFTQILADGTKKHWATYQEYLLSNENRKPLIYTNIARKDLKHKYLILKDFFNPNGSVQETTPQDEVITQTEEEVEQNEVVEDVPKDPLETLVQSSQIEDKEKLKGFLQELSKNPSLVEDILDANKQINKIDC